MNRHTETIIKLIGTVLLVIALLTTQPYNYYIFLRWFIFISSAYFAYNSRHSSIFGIIIFCAIAVLFNPFKFFHFNKQIWHIIDVIVAIMFTLSIDWKEYKASLSPKGNLIFTLIKKCFYGVIALIVALYFLFSITGNPYNEFLLITKATTTNGFITHSEEQEDVVEQEGRSSVQFFDVYYEYTFVTKNGKKINVHASDRNPESGYLAEANEKPIPIVVEYLSSNPQINRIKDMNTQCKTVTEFIWRRLGLGIIMLVLFCLVGFSLIKNAIKEYSDKKVT